nr:uncharacterized isomerase BH0283-like isoform X2 [Ziziphus jujuba var. spinosa]
MEFNMPVTCYLTRHKNNTHHGPYKNHNISINPMFSLRWFSPTVEVNLCGHGTLAAAHSLFESGLIDSNIIEFVTASGVLTAKRVSKNGEGAQKSFYIELNVPTVPITSEFDSVELSMISKALGTTGASIIDNKRTAADDHLVVLPSAKSVVDLQPDFDAVQKCPGRGIIVTGIAPPDSGLDFYSRFLYPKLGVNEDAVCGSAHCPLAQYWCKQLGKCDLHACAASRRGGVINIHLEEQNQRVLLLGKAFTVMKGALLV